MSSKHKAISYGRMEGEVERLEREIREFTAKAARVDAEEDELYGEGKEAHEIGEELKRREGRLKRIAEAKLELEEEARRGREAELRQRAEELRSRAETEDDPVEGKQTRARRDEEEADRLAGSESKPGSDKGGDDGGDGLPSHRVATIPTGKPRPEAQRNFTDPDSRIMKRVTTYLQGYNCQVAVDGVAQVILAEAVTNQSPDQEHLVPMMERVRHNTGRSPKAGERPPVPER